MDFYLAKHGLNKTWDLRQIGLSFLRDQKRGEEGEKRKREKKRKKKRRKGRRRSQAKRYGTTWAFKALNGFPCNCMVISCLEPRVLLGFHPNPIIIESKVDKTIKSTRSI